jgi:sugar lactone lactonase YvrE
VVHIDPFNRQTIVQRIGEADTGFGGRSVPNGLAMTRDGAFLIANNGLRLLERMERAGNARVICDSVGGCRLGLVNFVLRDSRNHLWLTVSTDREDWFEGFNDSALTDGYIVKVDEKGPRIVADGFRFTNECRFDASETYLYVVETFGRCIKRLPVRPDGGLGEAELYGPTDLEGIPDGIAFDSFGNLWVALFACDRLVAITPTGDVKTILEVGHQNHFAEFRTALDEHRVTHELIVACADPIAPIMSSIAFGGDDLRTVFIGTLAGKHIPFFRSPVPGLPMSHWT